MNPEREATDGVVDNERYRSLQPNVIILPLDWLTLLMLRNNNPNYAGFYIDADTPYFKLKGVADAIAQSQYLQKLEIRLEDNGAHKMTTLLTDVWEGLTRNRSIGSSGLLRICYLDVEVLHELFHFFQYNNNLLFLDGLLVTSDSLNSISFVLSQFNLEKKPRRLTFQFTWFR